MSVDVGLAWKAMDVAMLPAVTVAALRLQRAPGRSLRAREQDRVVVARRGGGHAADARGPWASPRVTGAVTMSLVSPSPSRASLEWLKALG